MKLRLSEAIRLGSMSRPKGKGSQAMCGYQRCALGAALFAIGYRGVGGGDEHYDAIAARWPIALARVAHPVTGHSDSLNCIVFNLNDGFDWTREQIADWVESIEQSQVSRVLSPGEEEQQEEELGNARAYSS